jgi:hypothetical protein
VYLMTLTSCVDATVCAGAGGRAQEECASDLNCIHGHMIDYKAT